MKKIIFFSLSILVSLSVFPKTAFDYNHKGIKYAKQEFYDLAIDCFIKAIDLDPEHLQSYENLATVYYHKGMYDESIECFNKIIELKPDDFRAYNNRGNIYYHKGMYKEALSDYNKAIELNHKNAYFYFFRLIASFKISKRNYKDALNSLKFKERFLKNNTWQYTILEYLTGRIGLNDILSIAKNKEKLCEAYCYIGYGYLFEGNDSVAKHYFQKCIETKVLSFAEYGLAKTELKRITEQESNQQSGISNQLNDTIAK
ncbi:MAG: tetratricopeptide repeat protein [Spirochaetes bacterium]|nr:tetratricopeptide repeat protein [Spirochaetota bacterium]